MRCPDELQEPAVRLFCLQVQKLLDDLDAYVAGRGMAANRSEAVRDLVRSALVREHSDDPEGMVFGVVCMVFDHHVHDLRDKLDDIRHSHTDVVVSSTHIHASEHYCLETIILRGKSKLVRDIADALLGTKGVLNGDLVVTMIPGDE